MNGHDPSTRASDDSAAALVSQASNLHPFDLQARAELATHGLAGLLDPTRHGLQYFVADWRARPPRADHTLWDFGDGSGRHLDALTLARTMARRGSTKTAPAEADEQVEAWVLRRIDSDGLSWLPTEAWARPWGAGALLVDPGPDEEYCEISWSQRGTLMGLLTRFLATAEDRYLDHAHGIVDGLTAIAEPHRDGLYFPEGYYRRGGWRYHGPNLHPCIVEYNAAVVPALLRLHGVSGYQPALDLAARLTAFALAHTEGYTPDGELVVPDGDLGSHFHTRSNFVLGVLALGLRTARPDLVSWATFSYEQLRRHGTDFGWFPEGIGCRHGELCCTTDMIELALLLGRHVDRRYYADAERYGRNHLLQSQWRSLDRLEKALSTLPEPSTPVAVDSAVSTDVGVAARQLGAFSSRPALNDAFHLDATAMMQCCNAAGTRALYDLWRYAVDEQPPGEQTADERATGGRRRVAVHLRFSVRTPTLEVVSHEPADGRLDLTPFRDCEIEVRLPEGTRRATLTSTGPGGSGAPAALGASDGYVRFEATAGRRLTLTYAQTERSTDYLVGSGQRVARATGTWRGETLIHIDPPGRHHPLYAAASVTTPAVPAEPARVEVDSI